MHNLISYRFEKETLSYLTIDASFSLFVGFVSFLSLGLFVCMLNRFESQCYVVVKVFTSHSIAPIRPHCVTVAASDSSATAASYVTGYQLRIGQTVVPCGEIGYARH